MTEREMRYLVFHDEWGVFLGEWLGMAFWSTLDAVGQTAAPTFESMSAALEFFKGEMYRDLKVTGVWPDDGTYITQDVLHAQGLGYLWERQ